MKAGFIGLGHLDRAMAGRLASQGIDLIFWSRIRRRQQPWGGSWACLWPRATLPWREKKSAKALPVDPQVSYALPPVFRLIIRITLPLYPHL